MAAAEYTHIWRMSRTSLPDVFLAYTLPSCVIGYEERGVKTANGKIQNEQEQSEAQPDGA